MRQGCLNLLLRLGTSVVSVLLIALGGLLLAIGLLSPSPLSGGRMALSILAALVAAYLFIRVGREIWRDLREPETPDQDGKTTRRPSNGEEK